MLNNRSGLATALAIGVTLVALAWLERRRPLRRSVEPTHPIVRPLTSSGP